jgi:hypothetical protein
VRLDNPGEYQRVDVGGSSPEQNSCANIESCAGCQDVVHKHQPPAVYLQAAIGGDPECTLHVDSTFGLGQPDLLGGGTYAAKHVVATGTPLSSEMVLAKVAA